MNRRTFQLGVCSWLAATPCLAAGKRRRKQTQYNLRVPTSGGQQLWADLRHFQGWRIQRHALTGHHRLLDHQNVRHAWGSFAACEAKLAEMRVERKMPPMAKTAVVLLHGMFRARTAMSWLETYLIANTKWQIINVSYPSTRGSVADHAETLHEVLTHLEDVETVHFVAHSLGNLVIRHWFNDVAKLRTPDIHPQVGRFVMLGPPNQKPSLATALMPLDRRRVISGKAGDNLTLGWKRLSENLATPPCEFGVIAGGLDNDSGYNPLIPGDDDMIVGVEETKLAGAADFRVLPVIHATMAEQRQVHLLTHRFLAKGFFESEPKRQRIG